MDADKQLCFAGLTPELKERHTQINGIDFYDFSEKSKKSSDRTRSNSKTMMVCFGEFVGRVDMELGMNALAVVREFNKDPNAAAAELCRRLTDES